MHHVYARGNAQQPIYLDDIDRWRYLRLLRKVIERTEWMCMAYCLMANHMHLLVETRTANLGAGMHRLHGSFAQYFNRRHQLSGHLFQGRYDAVPIANDPQLWMTAAYIVRNPVKAGLCQAPADWPWSSHAAVIESRSPEWIASERLESYFGAAGGEGLRRYAELAELPSPAEVLSGDSPRLGGVYGPEESERSNGRRNQKPARRPPTRAGAAQTIHAS